MKQKKIPSLSSDLCVTDRRENGGREQPKPVIPVYPPEKDRRAKSKRRGLIDSATCDRLYTQDDLQFMTAMDQYKRDNRRPFPTWSEVLEVLNALGYRRVAEPTQMPRLSTEMPPKVEV